MLPVMESLKLKQNCKHYSIITRTFQKIAVYALKKDTLAKFAFFYQVQKIYEEPINTNIKLESVKKA